MPYLIVDQPGNNECCRTRRTIPSTIAVPEGRHETVVNTNNMNTQYIRINPRIYKYDVLSIYRNIYRRIYQRIYLPKDKPKDIPKDIPKHQAYLNHLHKLQPATYRSLTNCVSLRHKRSIHGTWTSYNLHTNLDSLDNTALL